jgi:hypothetical protein
MKYVEWDSHAGHFLSALVGADDDDIESNSDNLDFLWALFMNDWSDRINM